MNIDPYLVLWEKPTWCPGCAAFGVQNAIQKAFAELNIPPEKILIVSGIGCSSKTPHWINTYGFHGIHGRALAIASGAKLANHELKVVVTTGDGDAYSIGANHFLHTARRNMDITTIVFNNRIYGLTKGQYSPTSPKGFISVSSPHGSIEEPINGIAFALAAGATFVARVVAANIEYMKEIIKKAILHKGFSVVEILMPCITYNKLNTTEFWQKMVYKLEEKNHNTKDLYSAYKRAYEFGEKNTPIGIFYQIEKPTYEEQVKAIKKMPLAKQPIDNIDIEKILKLMR